MQVGKLIAAWLPIALGVVMIGAGVVNFVGPRSVRDSFARWGYPAGFHRGDGRARGDRRIAAADPSYVACRRDRQRRNPSGRGDDADPSSRLDAPPGRRRADGGGGGGNDPRIDKTAAPEVFASRDHGAIVNSGSTVARRLMAEMRILIRASVFPHYLAADWPLSATSGHRAGWNAGRG